ncbi:MAG: hypothetical protein HY901_16240, partial [Deltaproteobacteria bacterium]|nr:hypothetical protein [Deltaproteobacteria bacterium]
MNHLQAIRTRHSVRTFQARPLEPEPRRALAQAVERCTRGPFGTAVRLVLCELGETERRASQALWTYGVIRNASTFLAGAVVPSPIAAVDYGHCVERFILEATKLGLGTCWLRRETARRSGTRCAPPTSRCARCAPRLRRPRPPGPGSGGSSPAASRSPSS